MKKFLFAGMVPLFLLNLNLHSQTAEMLNFDGTNDYVTCGNVLTPSYTKEAWINITNLALANNIISGGATDGQHVLFAPNAYGNRLSSGHNGTYNSVQDPTPLLANTWYHVAVTYDAATTTMKLYKNGVLVSTNTAVPAFTSGSAVRLGAFNNAGNLFKGNIDEVRIWNRALTAAEINSSMNCELAGNESGLIVYYNFNQGIPGGNNTGLTSLADIALPANNGTLVNFADNGATSNWISPSIITTGTSCSGCPSVTVTLLSQTNVSCNGGSNGSATVNASGGTSFTYSWSPSGGTGATASGLTSGIYTVTVTNQCANTGTATVNITQPSALVVSPVSQTNISCNGGSNGAASVTVSGGTTSYSYDWTPGTPTGDGTASVTGLTANTWTCTVTDGNSCTSTATFNITSPSALVVSPVSQTNVSCNGGSNGAASVTVSGGTTAYSYNWTPGNPTGDGTASVTGLTASSWTCTVTDANSCTSTATFNVTAPSAITSSVSSQTNISCNGGSNGSATVSASGGTPGYTYSWAPTGGTSATASGLTANTYTCTITDANSCTHTQTVNITAPSALVVSPVSQTNISCNGGSNGAASVTVSGGTTAYTYDWTPGTPTGDGTASVTGLTASSWTCTVTDANSCTSTATFNITAPSAITSSVSSQTNVSCNAGSNGSATVSASGGTPGYTYSWAPSGGTAATASGLTANTYTCTITDANSCTHTQTVNITQPSAITLSFSQTNVSCNAACDGSATVTPSGGTPGYTFSWSPSGGTGSTASGLCAGTYTCTVTDANNCVVNQTVNITQPAVLAVTATSTNVTCFSACNGTGTASVTGGTAPYSFSWTSNASTSSTASGYCPGTYTVTVTDSHSCTAAATITITEPSAMTASTMQTNVSCFGGNNGDAMVMASGGTGSYTYNWAPTGGTGMMAMNLTAGSYTCTTTDGNGCTLQSTFIITQPSAVTGTITSTNSTCFGSNDGSATVSASGGNGTFTYNWAPSGGTAATASPLNPATYTCTITDGIGCTGTATITITEPSPIVVTPSQTNVTCFGAMDGSATATSSGGTGAHSYSWSTGGNGMTESPLDAGSYTCTVTDVNGCSSSQTFQITEPTQIVPTHTSTDITCFGNTDGTASINVTGGVPSYNYSWAPGGYTTSSVTNLPENMYLIDITDATGCTTQDTITINSPSQILPTITTTNVTCAGAGNGMATVSVVGGTSPYSYSWSPTGGSTSTETNLGPGSYSVTVTDFHGCTGTQSTTITEPSPLTSTSSQTDNSCFGGSNGTATVVAGGGNGSYSYNWTPSGGTAATANGLAAGSYTCTIMDINGCSITNTFNITEPGMITVFETHYDETCFNGNNASATMSVSGGTGTISYAWSPTGGNNPTANGLPAGTYTCDITDQNGCAVSQTVTITEPASMLDNAVITNVSCGGGNNGSVVLNMSGGSSPYFYYWSDLTNGSSITGQVAGTYTITIQDANSCTITDSFTITEPSALAMSSTSTDITCHDSLNGTADITVSGGSPAYTYLWSTGGTTSSLSNLAAGNYNCVVTDANGCLDSLIVMVFDPGAINPFVINTFEPSGCGATDGGFNMSASGGAGFYVYSWSTGATTEDLVGVGAGVYTYTVTDANGCVGTFIDSLSDPNPPVVTLAEPTSLICLNDAAITLSGESPVGGTFSGTGVTGNSFDPFTAGNGTAVVTYSFTDTLGCTGTATDTIVVDPCTGVQSTLASNTWNLYPNPTTGEFHMIGNASGEIHIQCFAADGRMIRDVVESNSNDIVLSLEGEANGIYLVRVITDNGNSSFRITKN
ncbi:MAG TPA: LamG-like jellyroll fold domain-containing protein [Bacteroidia bacterium]|nr:LamG-like jellyroll fold domain-containing protein [Bacteroidia bacterium]